MVSKRVRHHQLGVTEGFQNGLLCQVCANRDKGVHNPYIRPDHISVIDKTDGHHDTYGGIGGCNGGQSPNEHLTY